MDKRKFNGGKSTKSKKIIDRRRSVSISKGSKVLDKYFDNLKGDIHFLYEGIYREVVDSFTKQGKYYVYFHYFEDEIVYIGKGIEDRAFNWTNRTNPKHSNLIKNGELDVKIISPNLDEDMSLLIESLLIKNYNPIFNKRI